MDIEALKKRNVSVITDEDLRGNDIELVKCRACSGYGACGNKSFFLYGTTPYSVCRLRLEIIQNGGDSEQLEE